MYESISTFQISPISYSSLFLCSLTKHVVPDGHSGNMCLIHTGIDTESEKQEDNQERAVTWKEAGRALQEIGVMNSTKCSRGI